MYKNFLADIASYSTNQKSCQYKMDANENFTSVIAKDKLINRLLDMDINRYPEGSSVKLRKAVSKRENLKIENILMGSGSSEVIELLFKCIIGSGDRVLGFSPSFSMYNLYANIQGANYETLSLDSEMKMDMGLLNERCKELDPKLVIICNPNNPTGSWVERSEIVEFLDNNSNRFVLLDEAYVEFMGQSSSDLINDYENLFVAKTFSKAYGLAGVRLGYMLSSGYNIEQLNKIRPPYNINVFTQICGETILECQDEVSKNIVFIKEQREKLFNQMKDLGIKVFPSKSNFIYFYSTIDNLQDRLLEKGVLIRKYSDSSNGYFRVTVGSLQENQAFIKSFREVKEIEKS
ncbi:MAG: histidinol-phosphate transaminase [Firmicutes bacterium]|nr:histidinol-phosphate transaminase [Bacillota bacterium]